MSEGKMSAKAVTDGAVATMRNFSFVVPHVVAGAAYPKGTASDVVDRLKAHGIKTVVNLTETGHLAAAEIRAAGINSIHLPVADFYCPTARQMEQAAEIVLRKENRPVLFHCAMGMGRTGVMLAVAVAALRHHKDPSVESHDLSQHPVDFVRSIRRGSIESRIQLEATKEYIRSLGFTCQLNDSSLPKIRQKWTVAEK